MYSKLSWFQLFVATCSPARDPNSQSDFVVWGNSSLIGPFGEVLAAAGHEDATVIGEIDLSLIEAVRYETHLFVVDFVLGLVFYLGSGVRGKIFAGRASLWKRRVEGICTG
uniref:CN hydrolase domain-containing protein n=1 Tax=Aegilops tauschii subsp. strangulata TaxID=200361 RepID=A0A453R2S8_AEGTS